MNNTLITVVIGPYCWGSGKSLKQAFAKARCNYPTFGEKKSMPYTEYEVSEDFEVDPTGTITATTLNKRREVRYEGDMRITTVFPAGNVYRERVPT